MYTYIYIYIYINAYLCSLFRVPSLCLVSVPILLTAMSLVSAFRVTIQQHWNNPEASVVSVSTHDPRRYDTYIVPIPWHTFAFPLRSSLFKPLLPPGTILDPYSFVRQEGLGPCGKVLFVFSEKYPSYRSRGPYVDVWSYCPRDKGRFWTVVRYWEVADPLFFWNSPTQEFIFTCPWEEGPLDKLRWFRDLTHGLPLARDLLGGPRRGSL